MIRYIDDTYKFDFSVQADDDFRTLKLVRNVTDNKTKKVMYVMDYIPRQSLFDKKGNLLNRTMLDTFRNLLALANLPDHDWLVCSYHACRTIGQSDGFISQAYDAFDDRLMSIIDQYKPDSVVIFGRRPYVALCKKQNELCDGNLSFFNGVPIQRKKDGRDIFIVKSVAIDGIFSGDEPSISLSGYIAQHIRNAYFQKLEYAVNRKELRIELIDTPQKFTKFMKKLWAESIVSIDTETDNLYKIKNRVLTIQFSFDSETSYIIPLCHKDSSFSKGELDHIFNKLREYFEECDAKYHIYVNAQFDLNVMRTQFGVRHYKTPVFDVLAAEMCLDENLKFLQTVDGGWHYSLGNLSVHYGDTSYLTASFSKSDRATISNVELNVALLTYMGLDTVIPFAIHELQLKRAADKNYKKYVSMVTEQMSDVIHSLAVLEYNGYPIDIGYLFRLKLPDSPIEKEIEKLVDNIVNSDAAKKVSKQILKEIGAPSKALFGDVTQNVFSLNKKDHLYKLFFEVLGLKPIKLGKNKKGKIDKVFQAKYSSIPEVSAYTAWQKACKLRNAYVNQIMKFWGENEDFKSDKRVRCRYNYLPVITGRVSASEPGLQQIPSRSELGKHIKRLFIAERGKFIVKVDYRAHEVRGWGIISNEDGVAKAFSVGQQLIRQYKISPSTELLDRIETEGDVHKVNCSYFFQKKIEDVTKDDRNAIKGVVFGLIYGQLASTMAKNLGKTDEEMKKIIDGFMTRFKNGTSWFTRTQNHAKKFSFVESPLGRRRRLYYIYSEKDDNYDYVKSVFDRRSCNSPIQGMGSDFMMIGIRNFCERVWNYFKDNGYMPYMKPCVSVHDSLEVETDYEHLLLTLNYIEAALTVDVKKKVIKRHNFKINSDLEIDYDLGVTTDKLHKWFGDLEELEYIAYKSIQDQNEKLGYNYSNKEIKTMMESIFQTKYMNKWMLEQAKRQYPRFLNYKFDVSMLDG